MLVVGHVDFHFYVQNMFEINLKILDNKKNFVHNAGVRIYYVYSFCMIINLQVYASIQLRIIFLGINLIFFMISNVFTMVQLCCLPKLLLISRCSFFSFATRKCLNSSQIFMCMYVVNKYVQIYHYLLVLSEMLHCSLFNFQISLLSG